MDDGPKNELPPLGLGLWTAAWIFLLMSALALVFARRLDAGDNWVRRWGDPGRSDKFGRNRKGGLTCSPPARLRSLRLSSSR